MPYTVYDVPICHEIPVKNIENLRKVWNEYELINMPLVIDNNLKFLFLEDFLLSLFFSVKHTWLDRVKGCVLQD